MLIELIAVLILVLIILGSVASGTLTVLLGAIIFATIVQLIWKLQSNSALRREAADAEDQLQVDIELLEACRRDRKISENLAAELVQEFGHIPDTREIGHAVRLRQRNLEVLRGMFVQQSGALYGSAILLGVATFLQPLAGIGLIGVYALTRLPAMRVLLRTT